MDVDYSWFFIQKDDDDDALSLETLLYNHKCHILFIFDGGAYDR